MVVQKCQNLGMLQSVQTAADLVFACCVGLGAQALVVGQGSLLLPVPKKRPKPLLDEFVWLRVCPSSHVRYESSSSRWMMVKTNGASAFVFWFF